MSPHCRSPRALGLTSQARALDVDALWPASYPQIGKESIQPELTRLLRKKRKTLGLNGLTGVDGEKGTVS